MDFKFGYEYWPFGNKERFEIRVILCIEMEPLFLFYPFDKCTKPTKPVYSCMKGCPIDYIRNRLL